VVTLDEDLSASANAHQLVADLGEARTRVAGAGECENGSGQQGAVESASEYWVDTQFRRHFEVQPSAAKAALRFGVHGTIKVVLVAVAFILQFRCALEYVAAALWRGVADECVRPYT
jgi:hypothetical protein